MKIKEDFILQRIADRWIVVNVDAKSVNFNRILTLNDSAKLLWDTLENGADVSGLVSALTSEYEVDKESAEKDVMAFVAELEKLGCIDDE